MRQEDFPHAAPPNFSHRIAPSTTNPQHETRRAPILTTGSQHGTHRKISGFQERPARFLLVQLRPAKNQWGYPPP
eukprot:COSAG02_NODE_2034_length_10056_cov_5.336748_4_plen_75_part_00